MQSSPQATESLIAVRSEVDNISSGSTLTDDQSFLLYLIMGTYFGPDLRGQTPQKSVFQRRAEGLPQYTYDQLTGSHIKIIEVERIYYYVLRKASPSVIVKLPWLHQFFDGNLETQEPVLAFPQWNHLFPPHLHPHSNLKSRCKIIKNIVFINNPETFYLIPDDIERFKRLTGLEYFHLDRDGARFHTYVDGECLYDVTVGGVEFNRDLPQPMPQDPFQPVSIVPPYNVGPPILGAATNGAPPVIGEAHNGMPMPINFAGPLQVEVESDKFEPAMIFLPSRPTREEWCNIVGATKSGYALTGSAATGKVGPVLGLIDIGECEDSYLFRVALPGVKRDESKL